MQKEIRLSLQKALILICWYQKYHNMLFLTGEKTWLKCDLKCEWARLFWVKIVTKARLRLNSWIDGIQNFVIERIYPSRMYRIEKLFLDIYFDGSNFLKREC